MLNDGFYLAGGTWFEKYNIAHVKLVYDTVVWFPKFGI